ncbi:hypothetical protein CPC08DRAFT_507354 [Agrocybe pediades]|nr:hypothetical protein CPC08DRAFT_507354 [Agrocybe pediades]
MPCVTFSFLLPFRVLLPPFVSFFPPFYVCSSFAVCRCRLSMSCCPCLCKSHIYCRFFSFPSLLFFPSFLLFSPFLFTESPNLLSLRPDLFNTYISCLSAQVLALCYLITTKLSSSVNP